MQEGNVHLGDAEKRMESFVDIEKFDARKLPRGWTRHPGHPQGAKAGAGMNRGTTDAVAF